MKPRFFSTNLLAALSMIASITVHAENTESTSKEESFLLQTSDKKTVIRGVISLPKSNRGKKFIPVVFVGGTSSSRDGAPYVFPSDPHAVGKLSRGTETAVNESSTVSNIVYPIERNLHGKRQLVNRWSCEVVSNDGRS